MGAFLYRLSVPNAFAGRAGYDLDASKILPQGVLAAINLIGGGAGDERDRAGAGYEVGLPLCSVAITTVSGVGSHPKLLQQKP